jgi:hypothetical protein
MVLKNECFLKWNAKLKNTPLITNDVAKNFHPALEIKLGKANFAPTFCHPSIYGV